MNSQKNFVKMLKFRQFDENFINHDAIYYCKKALQHPMGKKALHILQFSVNLTNFSTNQ